MPRALSVLTVAALAVALTGCTAAAPQPTPTPTDTAAARECATPGSISDAVEVTGEFGSQPTASFTAPIAPETTERTVVSEGDGAEAEYGTIVAVDFTLYNGTSGSVVTATDYAAGTPARFVLDEAQLLPGLLKTVECSTVGSRVVGAVPSADAFGEAGLADLGIAPGDPLVFVVDVIDVAPTHAVGEEQDAPEGFPTVELAADGTPTITIPEDYTLPTETESAVLIKGDGREVEATDTIWIQYQGVDAETGEIFDQTWGKAPYTSSASSFITGFTDTLVGQTVGSQFIVVIPPKDAYGEAGDGNTNPMAGKTLVFVVDVLAAEPAA